MASADFYKLLKDRPDLLKSVANADSTRVGEQKGVKTHKAGWQEAVGVLGGAAALGAIPVLGAAVSPAVAANAGAVGTTASRLVMQALGFDVAQKSARLLVGDDKVDAALNAIEPLAVIAGSNPLMMKNASQSIGMLPGYIRHIASPANKPVKLSPYKTHSWASLEPEMTVGEKMQRLRLNGKFATVRENTIAANLLSPDARNLYRRFGDKSISPKHFVGMIDNARTNIDARDIANANNLYDDFTAKPSIRASYDQQLNLTRMLYQKLRGKIYEPTRHRAPSTEADWERHLANMISSSQSTVRPFSEATPSQGRDVYVRTAYKSIANAVKNRVFNATKLMTSRQYKDWSSNILDETNGNADTNRRYMEKVFSPEFVDNLNNLIKKHNASNAEYYVSSITPTGYGARLNFTVGGSTLKPGSSDMTFSITPGFTKNLPNGLHGVSDAHKVGYYFDPYAPKWNAVNTVGNNLLHRDNTGGSTGFYKALNEALKMENMGFLADGQNGKSASSSGAWGAVGDKGIGLSFTLHGSTRGIMNAALPLTLREAIIRRTNKQQDRR